MSLGGWRRLKPEKKHTNGQWTPQEKTKASKGWAKICDVLFFFSKILLAAALGIKKNPFDEGGED